MRRMYLTERASFFVPVQYSTVSRVVLNMPTTSALFSLSRVFSCNLFALETDEAQKSGRPRLSVVEVVGLPVQPRLGAFGHDYPGARGGIDDLAIAVVEQVLP